MLAQVARVRFLVPARPTISVEKVARLPNRVPETRCKHCNCSVKLDENKN
jgi:hypothetical protein